MVAAGTEAPADPAYPVADATWEELRALLAALTDDALVGLRVVERLPSVSSGIVCLSAPYKGAELYLRHLARRAAASIGADFLAVWTHDIFPRLPPLAVLQSKPEQEGGRGRSKRGRDQQFMGPPGANIMITGLMGGPGGRFNVIGGGGGGDDGASEDGPITPYPWFRPYVGPQGDMAPLPTGRSPGPHQPAHHLNDGFASFFNLLSHTSPAGTKRPRPGRSVLTGERLPAHLPPLVVYYEDLAEVLRLAEEGETLSAADVVGGLAQAVGSVRRGENGRNVVVLVPHTRTFASPGGGKGDESAMFFGGGGPGVKAIRKFNLKDEEEEEDEDPSSGSGLPGIFGVRPRCRPATVPPPDL
ncbi:hypothetical protein DFJ74DRAFT_674374 [Hyaloraphidium curvatum]|nr:hypothetical protein DFJ74DRAFT_674374 [Hyaloraphidium curvatum]